MSIPRLPQRFAGHGPNRNPEHIDILLYLAALAVILLVLCGLGGCAQRTDGGTTNGAVSGKGLDAAIAIVREVDQEITRPALPDCLATKKTGSGSTGDAPQAAVDLPHVTVYAPSWCSGCPRAVAKLQKELGDEFSFEVFTNVGEFPEWVADAGGVWPIIEWTVGVRRWRINDYSTPEDFVRRWRKTADVNRGKQETRQSNSSASDLPPAASGRARQMRPALQNGYYPVRSAGGWWTHPGSGRRGIINHLANDGIHRGKWSREYLESLSTAELESLHSDDHEGRARRYAAASDAGDDRQSRKTAKAAGRERWDTRDGKPPGPVGAWIRSGFGWQYSRQSAAAGGYGNGYGNAHASARSRSYRSNGNCPNCPRGG